MNIRCSFCQTPYTLSRVAMLDALQEIDANKLTHYDAHCPRCRRATPIPRQKLEMFMPNWRDELKKFEAEMKEHPQNEAPLPKAESALVTEAAPAPEPAPVKKGATKPQPKSVPAQSSKPKPAARQTTPSAETKKSTARKTATKGTSKKSK
jgi:cell division septation protein DedD